MFNWEFIKQISFPLIKLFEIILDRIQYIKLKSDVREKLSNTLTSIPELKKY